MFMRNSSRRLPALLFTLSVLAMVVPVSGETIDLLTLVPKSHHVSNGLVLGSSATDRSVELPYTPPAEYDLLISFSRRGEFASSKALMDTVVTLPLGGKSFNLIMRQKGPGQVIYGFHVPRHPKMYKNGATRTFNVRSSYTARIAVRRNSISVGMNPGVSLSISDFAALQAGSKTRLAFSSSNVASTFHKIALAEISGRGAIAQDAGTRPPREIDDKPTTATPMPTPQPPAPAKPAGGKPQPGEIVADVTLEEPFADYRTGGDGRYIVLSHATSRSFSVFDVEQRKTVNTSAWPSGDLIFAAGHNKLVLVMPVKKLVLRYSLPELKREAIQPLEMAGAKRLFMGYASAGPLLIYADETSVLWDVDKMRPIDADAFRGPGHNVTVSGDGQTFFNWVDRGSGGTLTRMRFVNGKTEWLRGKTGIRTGSQYQPNRDGSFIYSHNAAVFNSEMTHLPSLLDGWPLTPTEDTRFFTSMAGWGNDCAIRICTAGDRQIVFSFRGLSEYGSKPRYPKPHSIVEPRIRFIPSAKILLTLPRSNDRVVIRHLDLMEIFKQREEVVVFSIPPGFVKRGKSYDYQIQAASRAGGFAYKLESGPKGMKVDEEGRLTWRVTETPLNGLAQAVVSVTDSAGNEALHSFDVHVTSDAAKVATVVRPAPGPGVAPKPSPPTPVTKPTPIPEPPEVVDTAVRHKLLAPRPFLSYGLGGEFIFLLEGRRLSILDKSGEKVVRSHEFESTYARIFERPSYYVALAPKSVDLIDKKTLAVKKSILIDCSRLTSLAIHPSKPISYVSVGNPTVKDYVRSKPVLEVNESTGQIRLLPDVYGNWVVAHPGGERLYGAVRDMYKDGYEFLGGRLVDDFGHIDYIIAYDLTVDPPREVARNENAGANGRNIKIAPDGQHLSYIAGGGAPGSGYSIAALAADDVTRESSRYKMEAYPADIAYHPSANLVATTNGNAIWVYDRHTGEKLPDKLDTTRKFGGVTGLFFAPGGAHLMVAYNGGSAGQVLEQVALKLTDKDRADIAKGFPTIVAPTPRHAEQTVRTWTDTTGRYKIRAALVRIEGDNVTLEREDGQTVSLPISRLSAAGQKYLRDLAAETMSSPAATSSNPPAKATVPNTEQVDGKVDPDESLARRPAGSTGESQPKTRSSSARKKPSLEEAVAALKRALPNELQSYANGQIYSVNIDILDVKMTDDLLRCASVLPELRWLKMGDCRNITDDGLAWLADAKGITQIYMNEAGNVTDAGIAHLAGLTEMKELTILQANLTNRSLEHMQNMTKMEDLYIAYSKGITDAGLVHLRKMKRLQRFMLDEVSVTGSGFVHFKELPELVSLSFTHCPVDDAAIEHLKVLEKLDNVNLRLTKVTPAAGRSLQKTLPDCDVEFTGK